jgi:hypothetical protein
MPSNNNLYSDAVCVVLTDFSSENLNFSLLHVGNDDVFVSLPNDICDIDSW